jgi:hypothetical protein
MASSALPPSLASTVGYAQRRNVLLNEFAISVRARAIVDEEVAAPQLVRNPIATMAYQWLRFIEMWAGGVVAEQ